MPLARDLGRVPQPTDATEPPGAYQDSSDKDCVIREPVFYTSKYDFQTRTWTPIPPTPRHLCFGEGGVYRRAK
jgi:hypothetical protein